MLIRVWALCVKKKGYGNGVQRQQASLGVTMSGVTRETSADPGEWMDPDEALAGFTSHFLPPSTDTLDSIYIAT